MKFNDLSNWGVDLKETFSRFVDDKDFYISCLRTFTSEEGFVVLEEAMEKKNYQRAFEVAHSLKGLTGNLGLTPLYESICVLVESFRHEDYSCVKEEYEKVIEKKEEFLEIMKD
ncbi:MAG: Hpt domain-containing protein [Sphaerochaetaceae bacterium]